MGQLDLSVVIPALGESENLPLLMPELRHVLSGLGTCRAVFGSTGPAWSRVSRSLGAISTFCRNSVECADYDARAYDSDVWLQRYWQRRRFAHISELIAGEGPVLDVGCGSSRLIGALPEGSLAIDFLMRKLRYARRFNRHLVLGSAFSIPVSDGAFGCVLCSQMIEHVPKNSGVLQELCRVLAPGGRLVLGTPDYDQWQWRWIEKAYGLFAPGTYADEHVAHYGFEELVRFFAERGYRLEAHRYIMKGELILAFRSP